MHDYYTITLAQLGLLKWSDLRGISETGAFSK